MLSDEKGTGGASLVALKYGPALQLRDEKGTSRVTLAATKYGPTLRFHDEKGTPRAVLDAGKDGVTFYLSDEKGRQRAVFGSTQLENTRTGATEDTGPSAVTLFGKNGKTIWRAP